MLITDYLDQLDIDKDTLYNNLVNAGISASQDETFTTLCPKVGEFVDLKDDLKPVINIAGGNITDEPLSEYPDILEESLINIWNNGSDIIFNNLPHVSNEGSEFNLQNTINARMKFNSIKGSIFQNPGAAPDNEKPVYTVSGNNDITIKQYEESEEEQVYNFNLGVENLYNPKNLKNGYLPNSGAYPTTSESWPNSKYLIFPIRAHQVLYIKNVNDVNNVASLKCIDKTTNEVVTYIATQENNYFTSTRDFSAGFDGAGTVTAKVDFIVGLNIKDPSLTFSVDMTIGDQYISNNPIELCKIGTYQDYINKTTGKNLFDKDTMVINAYINTTGWTLNYNADLRTAYIPCQPNTTYTVSKIQSARFAVASYSSLDNGATGTNGYADNSATKLTITTGAIAKYLCVFYYHTSDTLSEETIRNSIQIEKGNITNPVYEPYGNNKWYVHKEIGKVVLNGSENWNMASSVVSGTSRFYYDNNDVLNPASTNTPLSNMFKSLTWGEIFSQDTTTRNGVAAYDDASRQGRLIIRIDNTYASTVENFKTWLSINQPIVYYVLAIPTNTLIKDYNLICQLEDILNKASSYDDNTYLISLPIVEGEYPIINITALKESE